MLIPVFKIVQLFPTVLLRKCCMILVEILIVGDEIFELGFHLFS